MKRIIFICIGWIFVTLQVSAQRFYHEPFRPQVHFTPPIHWMNDPNGLVYLNGEYHLFYQYNPFGIRWGHMSWGHAVSRDLLHWQHLPVAIGELKDTMIFSGSAVVDKNNSSDFGKTGETPMVAIYTAHVEGLSQTQHIAYSVNNGRDWTKYDHNPVLDLHKRDFRDPKVFWYEPQHKWVMVVVLPIEKIAQFYSSSNLKQWTLMSEFGPAGDTTGIWECPDLFQVPIQGQPGKSKWVLMHSPAPLMQYFVGEFDGTRFTNENNSEKIYRPDYGPDYYAAITYNNLPAGSKPVSIGWINNWNYANDIPTNPWRSAMSLPREISLKRYGNEWLLLQSPVAAIKNLRGKLLSVPNVTVTGSKPIAMQGQTIELELEMQPVVGSVAGLRLAKLGDKYIEIGYDADKKMLFVDRSKAGDNKFSQAYARQSRFEKELEAISGKIALHVILDQSILEVFANDGEVVMTVQLFPGNKESGVALFSQGKPVKFSNVKAWNLNSIW